MRLQVCRVEKRYSVFRLKPRTPHAANSIHVVMQGSGRSRTGDQTFEWSYGDTIAVPGWCRVEHEAKEETVMFGMSDEALMRCQVLRNRLTVTA